jgi:ubiquinone/menaquinone biosynthesis C-methylase UbiE
VTKAQHRGARVLFRPPKAYMAFRSGTFDATVATLRGEIIEVGCGDAPAVAPRPGCSVTLVDHAPARHDQVTERRIVADVLRLPFPDSTFDAAVFAFLLCSVADPTLACGEIARVCKPEGAVVCIEHVRASGVCARTVQQLYGVIRAPFIPGCHVDRDPVDPLRSAGFAIEETQLSDHFFPWRYVLGRRTSIG